jgi:hypothetical protein
MLGARESVPRKGLLEKNDIECPPLVYTHCSVASRTGEIKRVLNKVGMN